MVAPPAGAWIETEAREKHRGCNDVAPPAGAWIETRTQRWLQANRDLSVAPPAGAWIETRKPRSARPRSESLPPRERGLKPSRVAAQRDAPGRRSPRGSVD